MRLLISISAIIILTSCSKQDHYNEFTKATDSINLFEKEVNVNLEKIETIILDENIQNISSFTFLHDSGNKSSLIYADEQYPTINKIDIDSKTIQSIGREGRGPFEYTRPIYVRVKNLIYVWDSMQLKFIVFDEEGNAIRESTTLTRALQKFDVINEDSLALYMSGGFEGPFIGIYSFSEKAVLEESLTGEQTKSDLLLKILQGTGGILAEYPHIYYVRPGSMNIHVINMITNEETVRSVTSPDFQVDEFDGDHRQFVNTDREGLVEYLMNNSAVMGIYKYQDFFAIKTVNGKAITRTSGDDNEEYRNRYYGFFILNDQFEIVGYFKRDFKINTQYQISENSLYELILNEKNLSGIYELNKYSIHINEN